MKLSLGLVLAAAVVAGGLVAREWKTGYIDSERIIAKYEGAVEAKKELNAEIAKFEARADSLKRDYEQARAEYESQQLTLSEEGKRAKLAEVEQRKRRYDSYLSEVYGSNGRIEQKNRELIAPIIDKIDTVVTKLAVEEGFTLIVDAAKAGVVYAASGLDLSDLVIAELNREFAPVTPGMPTKRVYAVMPLVEMNNEARQDNVGSSLRMFVYDLIRSRTQTEMVANARVDEVVRSRGYTTQQIQLAEATDVGRALNADYVIYGQVTKNDRRVSFELAIVDVRLSSEVKKQPGEAERAELLRERASSVVQVLLASVEKP
uniref:OmpH family outer membrane protein n=1 Tax=candidate division WOR-3 bacterium TaxID=2052148 RepID=A0A7C4GAI8_UNCW3